jgi:hypothetical protein
MKFICQRLRRYSSFSRMRFLCRCAFFLHGRAGFSAGFTS